MREVIPLITPWGMSSKFNMRIHSQAALMKIWRHAEQCGLQPQLSSAFPLFTANMQFALQSGWDRLSFTFNIKSVLYITVVLLLSCCSTATEKNSRKLLENFFYFKFDAVRDWSLEVSGWSTLLISVLFPLIGVSMKCLYLQLIFTLWPRLTSLSQSESMPYRMFTTATILSCSNT